MFIVGKLVKRRQDLVVNEFKRRPRLNPALETRKFFPECHKDLNLSTKNTLVERKLIASDILSNVFTEFSPVSKTSTGRRIRVVLVAKVDKFCQLMSDTTELTWFIQTGTP